MLVENMTIEEIHRELHLDSYDVMAYANKIKGRYLKLAKGRNIFPITFKPFNYKTRTNNSYFIIPTVFNKKERDKKIVSFLPVSTFFYNKGLAAALVAQDATHNTKFALYLPHLFRRYRERFVYHQ